MQKKKFNKNLRYSSSVFSIFVCLMLETPKSKYKHQTWLAYV